MTLEQLVGLTAEQWQQLPLSELHKHLEPYLHATRPPAENIKNAKEGKSNNTKETKKSATARAAAMVSKADEMMQMLEGLKKKGLMK